MTSDIGSGMINSMDETSKLKGAVDCDWVIIGKPGTKLNLRFLTQDPASSLAAAKDVRITYITALKYPGED